MKRQHSGKLTGTILVLICLTASIWWRIQIGLAENKDAHKTTPPRPSMTVTTTEPHTVDWPMTISATGTIEAWQEAIIGAEVNGLRLNEVLVNVGDMVKRGQVLANFANATIKAELAQAQAAVAEAEAMLVQAKNNADRTRKNQSPGVLSSQQIDEYRANELAAQARLESAKAQVNHQQVRLAQTQLTSPDDGLISSRTATVGAVAGAGQELFRLIRMNRLEWRAEVTAAELGKLQIGQKVILTLPDSKVVTGSVRMIAPTVDVKTRTAIVYVDVPTEQGMKAGMFARGVFEFGQRPGMILPQTAVIQREGFSYVYAVDADNKVQQIKIETGRRLGENVEILHGVDSQMKIAATGAAFLADGDTVRIANSPSPASENKQ